MTEAEAYRWRTEVRLAAVGPDGLAWPQRYLEWMQEAAARASDAVGFPAERYAQMNAAWLIREILLCIDRPLRAGEPLEVETWVSDLRRFRSRRQYRMRSGGEVVARAEVDWLFLERDPETGKVRPKHPDETMKAAFPIQSERVLAPGEVLSWPEGGEGESLAPSSRMVQPTELDRHGHMNHVHYLCWLEDHARAVMPQCAPPRRVRLFFAHDARPEERLELRVKRHGRWAFHQIFRGETLVTRAIVVR